ncbi:ATP-NAD kinase-like domain-containing protein [Kalaharituber pfeilii]|nr:ATP-NAD kinase-like domain-containing protein [Kalaharituber pfeilii]
MHPQLSEITVALHDFFDAKHRRTQEPLAAASVTATAPATAPATTASAAACKAQLQPASAFSSPSLASTGFVPLSPLPPPSPLDIPISDILSPAGPAPAASPAPVAISENGNSATGSSSLAQPAHRDSGSLIQKDIKEGASKPAPLKLATACPEPEAQAKSAPFSSFLRSPKGFKSHRQNALSVESIPRQTMLKALASTKSRGPFSAGLQLSPALRGGDNNNNNDDIASKLNSLTINTPGISADFKHPLQSPCFFHEKFDTAVNIDKVLEEVHADSEYMSHRRLLQTATGVREVARQLQRKPVKMQVKSVMIVTKARDNTLVTLTREVAHWLMKTPRYGSDLGVTVYVDEKLQKSKRFDAEGLIRSEPRFAQMLKYWTPDLCWTSPEKFDLVLTLGGDGTVLFTSWLFQRIVPPILSFSLGSLGFLTNFPFDMYKAHLDKVMTEGMRINMRMRFTCTVYRDSNGQMEEAEQFEVLNELVIDRGPSPYVSNLELYGDDELITVVQADGCIFSTPTGSTAYSLSAGGSLVHPDIPAILLTPICPHTLSFRPMLLNDSMHLRVSVPRSSRATAYCAFDGKGRVELKQGDHVTIAASQYPFPTVLSSGKEWFESIARTLRWNTRGAQQKAWSGGSVSGDSALGEDDIGGEEEWDIDTDSNVYSDNSGSNSPLKRAMLLGV